MCACGESVCGVKVKVNENENKGYCFDAAVAARSNVFREALALPWPICLMHRLISTSTTLKLTNPNKPPAPERQIPLCNSLGQI